MLKISNKNLFSFNGRHIRLIRYSRSVNKTIEDEKETEATQFKAQKKTKKLKDVVYV